ncbi:MAG: helix-turn-helix transcriptional regulator [Candidatus Izemoplasmatales bacterium]|nr:helix-turn-helix transcriptional regulator [Candidatus Izemoplasmatales bacterium]
MYYKKIHELRKANKLSQEELAQRLNVSRQTVSKWETGIVMPDINNLLKLSEIFNVSTDYILKEETKSFSYYPIDTKPERKIETYKLVAITFLLLSTLTILTFTIISILKPLEYSIPFKDRNYTDLLAYWYSYAEVRMGLILSLTLFILSLVTVLAPKQLIDKIFNF